MPFREIVPAPVSILPHERISDLTIVNRQARKRIPGTPANSDWIFGEIVFCQAYIKLRLYKHRDLRGFRSCKGQHAKCSNIGTRDSILQGSQFDRGDALLNLVEDI